MTKTPHMSCMLMGRWAAVVVSILFSSSALRGQEVLLIPSATQPSPGAYLIRSQLQWYDVRDGGGQIMLPFSISTGFFPRHSLTISSAGNFSKTASGMSDLEVLWKWRFLTKNTGAVDTSRTALLAGVQIPSGTGDWATGSFNPSVGAAHTLIRGRVGFGGYGLYKLNTGSGALLDPTGMNGKGGAWTLGASTTWRIHPASYTAGSKGAWYLAAEGAWTGGAEGDSIRIGPSLFYEAETWVIEAGWQYYPMTTGSMMPVNSMGVVGVRFFF